MSPAPLPSRAPLRNCAQAVAQDASSHTYLLAACTSADPIKKLLSSLNTCHAIRVPDTTGVSTWPSVYAGTELTLFAANETSPDFLDCITDIDSHDSPTPSPISLSKAAGIGAGVFFGLLGLGLSTLALTRWWRGKKHTQTSTDTSVPQLRGENVIVQSIEMREMASNAQLPAYNTRAASPVSSMFKAPVESISADVV